MVSRAMTILVAAAVMATPLMAQNLLTNPGFEQGLTDWTSDGAAIRTGDPAPHGGTQYLMGSTSGRVQTRTWQAADLVSLGYPGEGVGGGQYVARYGGWQAGWNTQADEGLIELEALDAGSAVLAAGDLGWFHSNHTWFLREGTLILPAGTAALRYSFTAVRHEGYNNDGYLDDAFLEVAALFPGDANLDGTVDLADLALLASHWNQSGGAAWGDGDFTGEGDVDLADLALLAGHWNQSAPPLATAGAALGLPTVPEPATLGLLAVGLAALVGRRRGARA